MMPSPAASGREALLAGIEAGFPLSGPETIHIDITNSCNANCLTCWDHSPLLERPRPRRWKARMADPAFVEALLDDATRLGGLRAAILSGRGEPFLHPAVERMIRAVKARGLRLTIITNLMAPAAADADKLAELGVDEILAGVHAGSEASYRAMHPSFPAGSWEELQRRLGALAAAGRSCKHAQVICAPNADELPAMVELGARLGASALSFKLASLGGGTEACRISEERRKRLVEEVLPAAAAKAEALGVRANLGRFGRQLEAAGASPSATVPIARVGCLMGYAYARVTVERELLYCCDGEARVGRLGRDARFAEAWRSPAWEGLRARLRQGRYFPGCARCGKYAQNEALGALFAAAYGERRLAELTGRAVPDATFPAEAAPCP